ncbi:hypothetical protein L6R46_09850 [Myxococcota bacterium]|nr:hypothetical protein [Myxococcota bacterium]
MRLGYPLPVKPLRPLLPLLLALGLTAPFVDKPPHIDDPNFLVLARGAALDPWRPHDILINWQGTTERAFDVLSNPPGVAWWLAPWVDAPIEVLHLVMWPWLLLVAWGAARLGEALVGEAEGAAMLLLTSPILLLAAQALTPDLPLAACALAGLGGFLTAGRGAWAFALLAGCAALFRYSGICLIPLVLLMGWQRGRLRAALPVILPTLGLALHDLHAYGAWHLLAMTGFQSVSDTPRELVRKGVAAVATLGGAALLPLALAHRRGWVGAALGLGVGGVGVLLSAQTGVAAAATLLSCAAGGAGLASLRLSTPADRLLWCWGVGGLLFLLTLRFAAARYWLAFWAGPALATLRLRPPRGAVALACGLQALLALGLAIDDRAMARAWDEAGARVARLGVGQLSGHWGWQHSLEARGWRSLEEGARPEGLYAVAEAPWPQEADPTACLSPILRLTLHDTFWGPRVHSGAGGGNLHAYLVAKAPPVETYAPWTFSDEPYDTVTVSIPCEDRR